MIFIIILPGVINVSDKSNHFIKSEQHLSKSLIYSLFAFGDMRSCRNRSHPFIMLPLYKLAKLTCVFENPMTNEYFKEMFHSMEEHLNNCNETSP